MKTCTQCGETKPLDQFYIARGKPESFCKECRKACSQRVWRAKHPPKPADPAGYKTCNECGETKPVTEFHERGGQPGTHRAYCRACHPIKAAASYARHKAGRREAGLRYRAANWARDRAAKAAYRLRNKERARNYWARRRARQRAATIGPVDYQAIWARDSGICYLCGLPVAAGDLHYDHVIPLSRGGAHTMDNIRVTHARCNRRKCAKLPHEL